MVVAGVPFSLDLLIQNSPGVKHQQQRNMKTFSQTHSNNAVYGDPQQVHPR